MSDERNLKTAWVHHYGSTHGYDKAIERVRQAVLVEAAHAVLLERTRIVEWLSIRQVEEYADFDKSGLEIDQERGLVLDVVRQEIERGAHNEVTK